MKKINISIQKGSIERELLQQIIKNEDWMDEDEQHFQLQWRISSNNPAKIKKSQRKYKINKIYGIAKLTEKWSTALSFNIFKSVYPEYDYHPKTYLLGDQYQQFKREKQKDFIIKPIYGSEGQGIFFYQNDAHLVQQLNLSNQQYVAQQYIQNPLLLDGKKFDLRVYCLITNLDPYICYIYEEGLVRVCAEKYDNSQQKYSNLTNYSLNANSPNFIPQVDDFLNDQTCNKRSFQSFRCQLKSMDVDDDKIFQEIERIVALYLRSLHPFLIYYDQGYKEQNFAILGLDILIDSQLKVWLLEGNSSPSLNINQRSSKGIMEVAPLDYYIKYPLVKDAILLSFQSPQDQLSQQQHNKYKLLNHNYQLQSDKFLKLLQAFWFCSGTKELYIKMSQFLKLTQFPGLLTQQIRKADYELSFINSLTDKAERKISFWEFIIALQDLSKKFSLSFEQYINIIIINF